MCSEQILPIDQKKMLSYLPHGPLTTHIPGGKSKPFLGQLYTLSEKKKCSKSLPALMKYTQPGNYNTWLNNSKKEVFILKHDFILETYTEGN